MARKWTESEDNKIVNMRNKGQSFERIAAAVNATVSQVRHRYCSYKKKVENGETSKGNLTISYPSKDACEISYIGNEITSVDDLIASAKIDLTIWEVSEVTVNSWEVAGKKGNGQDEFSRWKPETLWKTPLRQIKAKLKRLAPKHIQDTIKDLIAGVQPFKGKFPALKRKKSRAHLLEISLYDAHFGKLCWGAETGIDYDLKIAASDYSHAVEDLLDMVRGFEVEKVCFPVGHDFFHVDNWSGTTAAGTVVDSTDDRFKKVFRVGFEAVRTAVMKCAEVAEVEVLWVCGNHDSSSSWYLTEMLSREFRDSDRIKVDNSCMTRKYRLYGISMIGYDHGDGMPLDRLPLIMATEKPDLWAKSVYRHYRVGHFHKKKQLKWVGSDTFNGVEVTVLPSLSGTDKWHYENGFVNNLRTAEAALWNRDSGYAGSFSVEARSAIKARASR